jgi:hypothetical protein
MRCSAGRTTADNATQQRVVTDCYVMPGFGVVSSVGNSSDGTGFLENTSSLTAEVAASLPVLQCPLGYYGAGGSLGAVCTRCPLGSTTEEVGATNSSRCSSECVCRHWLDSSLASTHTPRHQLLPQLSSAPHTRFSLLTLPFLLCW